MRNATADLYQQACCIKYKHNLKIKAKRRVSVLIFQHFFSIFRHL